MRSTKPPGYGNPPASAVASSSAGIIRPMTVHSASSSGAARSVTPKSTRLSVLSGALASAPARSSAASSSAEEDDEEVLGGTRRRVTRPAVECEVRVVSRRAISASLRSSLEARTSAFRNTRTRSPKTSRSSSPLTRPPTTNAPSSATSSKTDLAYEMSSRLSANARKSATLAGASSPNNAMSTAPDTGVASRALISSLIPAESAGTGRVSKEPSRRATRTARRTVSVRRPRSRSEGGFLFCARPRALARATAAASFCSAA
mmetsp:Transcript_25934/g.103693  ORF Transcript_25934/g.103693 Transcript_25934/m.103693 type:complete len:261 (-) Transcript_25934:357-1139(-)